MPTKTSVGAKRGGASWGDAASAALTPSPQQGPGPRAPAPAGSGEGRRRGGLRAAAAAAENPMLNAQCTMWCYMLCGTCYMLYCYWGCGCLARTANCEVPLVPSARKARRHVLLLGAIACEKAYCGSGSARHSLPPYGLQNPPPPPYLPYPPPPAPAPLGFAPAIQTKGLAPPRLLSSRAFLKWPL
jgi:hypothetical protein